LLERRHIDPLLDLCAVVEDQFACGRECDFGVAPQHLLLVPTGVVSHGRAIDAPVTHPLSDLFARKYQVELSVDRCSTARLRSTPAIELCIALAVSGLFRGFAKRIPGTILEVV
jgi:hypothetical protein